MERDEAHAKLSKLIGKDLRQLADEYNVTVFKDGKKNKGWAGHVIERYLGLPLNSSRSPNFGSWELKLVSLKRLKSGIISVKETMAITMIDPVEVLQNEFEDSHLYRKLRKAIIVGRIWESQVEEQSLVHSVDNFDLDDPQMYDLVKKDYELVRQTLREKGFDSLTGKMGAVIQPRTKGAKNTTSRAFYARTQCVAYILGLRDKPVK